MTRTLFDEVIQERGRSLRRVFPFYIQEPRFPYRSIGAQNEDEVRGLLQNRPGWKVWQYGEGFMDWDRREDLEMEGAGR